MKLSKILGALIASSAVFAAHAGEGAFGWVYTLDFQPKGKYEFEQKVDTTRGQASGTYHWTQYRSEIEYGLTDNIQVSAYLNADSFNASRNYVNPETCGNVIPCTAGFGVPPSVAGTQNAYRHSGIDGESFELMWRITNPVTSPVGVGLYVEPTFGKLEDELETRLMLQSNFLDDRLIVTANILSELEYEKYSDSPIQNSMFDLLYGVNYRFAPSWSGGIEGRLHTDYDGNFYQSHSQTANFIGPVMHYADKNWWATFAWRRQLDGHCFNDGTADCTGTYVSDNHGRNEFMFKVGIPLN